jgi:diguanylate cyclase (GGDEF)-like protein
MRPQSTTVAPPNPAAKPPRAKAQAQAQAAKPPHPALPRQRLRLGVRTQLVAGFVAVAVLAVTANVLLHRDNTAIRTRVETIAPAPAQAVEPAQVPPQQAAPRTGPATATASGRATPAATSTPAARTGARAPVPASRKLAAAPTPDSLLLTLAGFHQRVISHGQGLQPDSSGSAPETYSGLALASATERFALEAARAGASAATLDELRQLVRQHESSGLEIERTADRRAELVAVYRTRTEALGAEVTRPLDASVKVFGRIYARDAVLAINQAFDSLRERQQELVSASGFTLQAMQAAAAAEDAFTTTLAAQERSLSRNQGGGWPLQLRGNLAEVTAARETVARLDATQAQALQAFVEGSQSIESAVRSLAKKVVRERRAAEQAARKATAAAGPAPAVESATGDFSDAPASLIDVSLSAPMVRTVTERITTESASSLSMLWVSAAVLLLMLFATLFTVVGVTRPVRRLTEATRRIARGDTDVSLPRGGARELDELGLAFNDMARELTGARTALERQQQRLELEVAERTSDLQHLAENDPLTHLPNRRRLFTHLSEAIARADHSGEGVAVMFLDVDNFKTINDSLNHEFGDEVLRQISTRLRAVVGPDGFCARLGGDEFTVVVEGPLSESDLSAHAARLIQAFEPALRMRDQDLKVTVSIGVGKFPEHAADAEGLLRAADTALFRSKERGRNQFAVFDRDMQEEAARKFTIEQGLHAAIERDELRLVFQPEVELDSLEPVMVEALLRWQQPDGRLAAPGEFLAVAEQSRLILDIGDWVMREAIRTLAAWRLGPWPSARIAVNVSARQLMDGRFPPRVADLLAEHNVPPAALEIELTESVLQTGPQTVDSLRELHRIGVSIALDDFGAGYSSIASLEQLPLTRVKLDRSLVAAIDSRDRSLSIARSIISLCRGLGLQVTAEGVERPTQLALLAREGDITVQGYLLSRPIPEAQWLELLPRLPGAVQEHLLDLPAAPLPSARRPAQAEPRMLYGAG